MNIRVFGWCLLLTSTFVFARQGDEVGNGGFAYKQSKKLLKISSVELYKNVQRSSQFEDFRNNPERKEILEEAVLFDNLDQQETTLVERQGQLLMFDYSLILNRLIVYKPYFDAFAGTADSEMDIKKVEVKKRLLHEAAHLWGDNETASEDFALRFLSYIENPNLETAPPPALGIETVALKQYLCSKFVNSLKTARYHYYFIESERPNPLPVIQGNTLVCHDPFLYGAIDSSLFPRLAEEESGITLWDKNAKAFIDADHNGIPDITDSSKLIFSKISGNFEPIILGNQNQTLVSSFGYVLTPFFDKKRGRFCPKENDFQLLSASLKNTLSIEGIDTQKLFSAENTGSTFPEESKNPILITEEQVMANGFYRLNQTNTRVDSNSLHSQTIYFYWPLRGAITGESDSQIFKLNPDFLACIPKE